jgi:RNA polymerase sigma-70 factor, ECF subfamily
MKKSRKPDELLILHERLLSGDRIASEELARHVLRPLVDEVSRKFPTTDADIVCDGVTDAILDYCAKPTLFNPGRGLPLARFLQMASWRNVANLVRSEKRRKAREQRAASEPETPSVELDPAAGKVTQEEFQRQRRQTAQMLDALENSTDRRILELRLSGERRTEAFAKMLGISDLSLNIQRRKVKQAKDRIDKILHRHGRMIP